MTAVSLFDVLARRGSAGAAGSSTPSAAPSADLIAFAERLVADSLADFARVREYEEQFAWSAPREPQDDLDVMRTVARLYADWADEAAQVINRVESLGGGSRRFAGIEELHDALGRTRARLTVTPEQIAKAKEQVRQGRVVPAKELRDELHARLRA